MEKYTLTVRYFAILLFLFGMANYSNAQRSLYQDDKALRVGDVLTVVLQENISGSTSSDAQNSSYSEAGAAGSATGNFMPFQPTFGADAEVSYDADEQKSTNQGQLLEGYMSVEVVEISPSGNLIVEGMRSTEINGERHQIELSGMVRPRDVNGRNQVLSYRMANAKINYDKDGDLRGITKKRGFLKRAALTVAGIGLGVVAILKGMN